MKLKLQLFATNGTINGTSTASNCSTRVVWSETTRDISTGTITIKVSAQIYKSGSSSTTGTFSGTLKVDGISYNISKSFNPYNWGKWAEVGNKTIIIQNASNKEVPINLVLTQSGTSMAGTYRVNGTAQLDTLFEPPVIDSFSLTEINPHLQGVIADNIFVENLSIKSFQINATFKDGATANKYMIFNGIVPYSSTNYFVTLNCVNNENFKKDENGKAPIRAGVIDSNESVAFSDTVYYDVIPYTGVNIVETATFTKRNGQTTGKVYLNVQGTYYNGNIGTLSQSGTYTPRIQYKYWKYGEEEPNAYMGEVSSSKIDTNNGIFYTNNCEIGTPDETQPNWFDPESAYRFRIKVSDRFTNYESTEKSIAVGDPLWGEYKDRVNFKKLTIRHQEILAPFILFDGDTTGNITLTDSAENYEYIEFFYKYSTGTLGYSSIKIYEPNGKTANLSLSMLNNNYLYFSSSLWNINGKNITKTINERWRFASSGNPTRTTSSGDIYIYKIIGYK